MNPKFLKSMRQKKKRAVDPNIPRPNLFSHDKEIRGIKSNNETVSHQIAQLQDQVRRLESKLRAQTNYLSALHNSGLLKK